MNAIRMADSEIRKPRTDRTQANSNKKQKQGRKKPFKKQQGNERIVITTKLSTEKPFKK